MNAAGASGAQLRREAAGIVDKLASCRERVLQAQERGRQIAQGEEGEMEWRVWTQGLPPVAFEIARETKELVRCVDGVEGGEDDFA